MHLMQQLGGLMGTQPGLSQPTPGSVAVQPPPHVWAPPSATAAPQHAPSRPEHIAELAMCMAQFYVEHGGNEEAMRQLQLAIRGD